MCKHVGVCMFERLHIIKRKKPTHHPPTHRVRGRDEQGANIIMDRASTENMTDKNIHQLMNVIFILRI